MNLPSVIMLSSGGLFTGSVTMIAWNRVRAWRTMPDSEFRKDFIETIQVADKLQPILLVITLAATIWFTPNTSGISQIVAYATTAVLAMILVASLAILVPLQNHLIAAYSNKSPDTKSLQSLKLQWLTGHIGRSVISVIALFLLIVAAATA
jgi:hypothetical protein